MIAIATIRVHARPVGVVIRIFDYSLREQALNQPIYHFNWKVSDTASLSPLDSNVIRNLFYDVGVVNFTYNSLLRRRYV